MAESIPGHDPTFFLFLGIITRATLFLFSNGSMSVSFLLLVESYLVLVIQVFLLFSDKGSMFTFVTLVSDNGVCVLETNSLYAISELSHNA